MLPLFTASGDDIVGYQEPWQATEADQLSEEQSAKRQEWGSQEALWQASQEAAREAAAAAKETDPLAPSAAVAQSTSTPPPRSVPMTHTRVVLGGGLPTELWCSAAAGCSSAVAAAA